jgi:hypothetical protein
MMKKPPILLFFLLNPTASHAKSEAFEVDRRVEAAMNAAVTIEVPSGELEVIGRDLPEVHVVGRVGRGAERIDVENEKDRTIVRVVVPRGVDRVEGTRLRIEVPKTSRVELLTISADTRLVGIDGSLVAKTTSGDLEIKGSASVFEVTSVSGNVEIMGEKARIVAEVVSGDVIGQIEEGSIRATTVSGDLRFTGKQVRALELRSVSGDVSFRGAVVGDGRFDVASQSGDVDLAVPDSTSASFELKSFSGDVSSPSGFESGRGPGRERKLTLGAGSTRVSIASFSGDVSLSLK